LNLFVNKKKTREVPVIPEYMFKEEEHDNYPSIQWIRENSLTVNISINSNGLFLGHFFTLLLEI